jgi:membrane protein
MRAVNVFDRVDAWYERGVARARKASALFDHAWRAKERFDDVLGGRLAAAISYYGFFAAFSLAVVAYSILGRILNNQTTGFVGTVNTYLEQSLTWVRSTASQVGSGQVTTIGLVSLLFTGVAWVDALRSSVRAIWQVDQHPGHWIVRRMVDLGMLIVVGLLLTLSLATAGAIDSLLGHLVAPATGVVGATLLRGSGPVLEFAVNLVLGAALMVVVPRLRLSPWRLFPAAILVAVGVQLLNTFGRLYISALAHRPAYQLVVGAVGLLVYLYLLNQLILYAAAVAATGSRGSMVDMAGGARPTDVIESTDALGEPRGPSGS